MRIVSLLSSATEMLCGLGLVDQLLAVGHECDWPSEVLAKPKATASAIDSSQPSESIDRQVKERLFQGLPLYSVDAELLARLGPDLIVTQAQCDVCAVRYQDVVDAVNAIPELASTKVIALNPHTIDDVLADIAALGQVTDRISQASTWLGELRQRIAAIRHVTHPLAPDHRTRVAIIEWTQPLMLAANWTPQLLQWAGGDCPLTVQGQHSTYADWRQVAQFDPQVIIVAPCGFGLDRAIDETKKLAEARSEWATLRAVQTGRVFAMDGNAYLNRSGPRLVDTLEILARLVQPERFKSFSVVDPRRLVFRQVGMNEEV
jgi:iron complex transport system substrate-binding protein